MVSLVVEPLDQEGARGRLRDPLGPVEVAPAEALQGVVVLRAVGEVPG
jgi:hypothetical protein